MNAALWQVMRGPINDLRGTVLGLDLIDPLWGSAIINRSKFPVTCSETLGERLVLPSIRCVLLPEHSAVWMLHKGGQHLQISALAAAVLLEERRIGIKHLKRQVRSISVGNLYQSADSSTDCESVSTDCRRDLGSPYLAQREQSALSSVTYSEAWVTGQQMLTT